MLSAAFYFKLAIYWTPGHDWYPLTVSFPLFYLLFSLHSITFLTTTTFLSFSFFFLSGTTHPCVFCYIHRSSWMRSLGHASLLLWSLARSCFTTFAAASFFERTYPSRALVVCRNDGIPLCCYRIHCRSLLTRTLAAASYHERAIDRTQARLAAASFFELVVRERRQISLF